MVMVKSGKGRHQNTDTMRTIFPWHSTLPGIAVYHNNTDCTEGNNIESRNRASGTGGKHLCDHCKRLNK